MGQSIQLLISQLSFLLTNNWARTWDFRQCGMCNQQRLRSAGAYAVWSEPLLVFWIYYMSVKLLTEHHLEPLNLKGGCTGSSESTFVRMPHCWKSLVADYTWYSQNGIHIVKYRFLQYIYINNRRVRILYSSYHLTLKIVLYVWFESLLPSQQFFSYVRTGHPGMNQYSARFNVFCSRTQCSDDGEATTCNPLISSSTIEPLCFLHWKSLLNCIFGVKTHSM